MNSKTIKILAIGNSFSVDSMEYLFPLLNESGYDNIILGNLYIGGCCLETHVNNAYNNISNYIYYLNTDDTWEEHQTYNLPDALISEKWDIITMQQCSGKSGLKDSYQPYLDKLISFVRKYNKEAKLYWNMTWAYHHNSNHGEFINYDCSQNKMYQSIISIVKEVILSDGRFEKVIPTGTAIQNLRTVVNDDLVTRDGFHLSLEIGRFLASLTWYKTITGQDISDIRYHPDNIDDSLLNVIKKAADAALECPFNITDLK